jgi:hypothetical protein
MWSSWRRPTGFSKHQSRGRSRVRNDNRKKSAEDIIPEEILGNNELLLLGAINDEDAKAESTEK